MNAVAPLRRWLDAVVLAALAIVPPLVTAPGVVAADTKQYLVLDPGRLLATARSLWDPGQFGGHVTHQQIGYLWPMGPWFRAGQALGLPMWVTQRLWLAALFLAAGLGLRALARRQGLAAHAAFAAAVAYQLSPYLLTYVNRTSGLLLPWAGLPWLLVATELAVRRPGWRWPAVAGLIVATIGGLNATAVVLVALAPALWLAFEAHHHRVLMTREHRIGAVGSSVRGGVVGAAWKLAVAAVVLSLWWFVGLVVEGRYGADVLAYSETVGAVSTTASATEGLRGLGYWLFYGGGVDGAWNSAARPYLANPVVLTVGFTLAALGLLGLVLARWRPRRWLALQALAGLALASAAFPPSAPSLLGRAVLHGNARSTLVLALRSSTRALPLVGLALALGLGAVVHLAAARVAPARRWWVAAGAAALCAVNLPALVTGDLVDATLRRPAAVPSWWRQVAAELRGGQGRVLEIAGQEFGAYRWGTTTDPLLPGLQDRPVLTRDLLPLGSPDTMDLLWALDDRFQAGTAEPAALAPVARFLGATDVVARLDAASERYRTPLPSSVAATLDAAPGLGPTTAYGPVAVAPAGDPPDIDRGAYGTAPRATPEVARRTVDDPVAPTRAAPASATVVLAGSGDGVVDAAGAGLLDGTETVRYAATLGPDEPVDGRVIVTDSNRKRARQWRGTQDTVGLTEDASPSPYPADEADARLPVFPGAGDASQTVTVFEGGRAVASAYGEPNAYRPEDRAAYAVDGDLATAWRVGDRGDPVGARLRVDLPSARAVDAITLQLPARAANRAVAAVVVRTEHTSARVTIDDPSTPGASQRVLVGDASTAWVEVEIAATTTGDTPSFFGLDAVGFAEVRVGDPVREVVRLPTDVVDRLAATGAAAADLTYVLTRERTDPTNRWRDDPERALARRLRAPSALALTPSFTVRLDRRADDAVLAPLLHPAGTPSVTTSSRLAGRPDHSGYAALDADATDGWWSAIDDTAPWWQVDLGTPRPLGILRLAFASDGMHRAPTQARVSVDGVEAGTVAVGPDGAAVADLTGRTGSVVRVEPLALTPATGVERRYGETVQLPVVLRDATLDGVAPVVAPTTIDTGCRDDLVAIDGVPVPVRVTGSTTDALAGAPLAAMPCGVNPAVPVTAGDHDVTTAPGRRTGLDIDRIVLRAGTTSAAAAPSTSIAVRVDRRTRTTATVTVAATASPTWFVWGEGHNAGWHATIDGRDLGPSGTVVGGGNAWLLPASTTDRTITLRWTPQRWVDAGLAVSGVGALVALVLALWPRRRATLATAASTVDGPALAGHRRAPGPVVAGALVLATALVTHPVHAIGVLAVWVVWRRRPRRVAAPLVLAGPVLALAVGAYVTLRQIVSRPAPGFGWPLAFADVHRLSLVAVVLVVLAACGRDPGDEAVDARGGG